MSFLSHLNTNARRLCSTYRPYRHVGHVLSLLLLYFFSGDRYGPGRTSYYILTTPSFSLCTRKWIFTQILACHVTRLTGPIVIGSPHLKDTFLAHLSWKLKWAFLITCRPSSVCLSVCKLFTFSSSSPEPLGQFQPNLAQSILGWRGFKFVQMKGPALFQGEIITK